MATIKREDYVSIEKNPNGVCTIWMDQKNEKINKVGTDLIGLFEDIFKELNADDSIKAFVLSSKKKDFIAGADIEMFQKVKMKLYWIELPPMGPGKYHLETRYINICFKEVSDELGFTYIPTNYVLGDEKGQYQKYLPYRGRKTLMRADDDIHLTVVAAKLIVREILKKIFVDYYFPE